MSQVSNTQRWGRMGRKALVGLAALGMLAGCKGAPADADEGMAAGAGANKRIMQVWQRLGKYEAVYLKEWKGAFANPKPEAADVLDAFNEIAYATTGPAGFWRSRVPNQWFGCKAQPDSGICQALTKAGTAEFAKWDKLQEQIANLAPGKQKAFLAKHAKELIAYLDTYVPEAPSATAMKKTGFYAKHLKGAMEATAGGGAPVASDDEL